MPKLRKRNTLYISVHTVISVKEKCVSTKDILLPGVSDRLFFIVFSGYILSIRFPTQAKKIND